jgi:DNA ligase-1
MGLEPGKGKHKGRMGAIVCGLYVRRKLVRKISVGGGFTDELREEIWKRCEDYIGRVIEVRGWQVFDSGSLRHPQFVRFRDDKKASDCKWEE